MNNRVVVNRYAFIFADGALFATQVRGLIHEVKIPVQELGGQRGEGLIFKGGSFSREYGNLLCRSEVI